MRLPCPFTPAVHKNITLLLIFMIELTTYVYFYFFLFSECGKKIVGVFSGVGHSTGEKAGPTEVDTYSRCWRNCLQLLGFWNFLGFFFRFFRLKLVYFWTKNRKNIYGCFFHSFCATYLNFGTKNNGRMQQSAFKISDFWKLLRSRSKWK